MGLEKEVRGLKAEIRAVADGLKNEFISMKDAAEMLYEILEDMEKDVQVS